MASAPDCHVRVLHDVTDDLGNHWQVGRILPVTIERDDANGGEYCAHGGSCIPRKVDGAVAVKLTDCVVGPKIDATDYRLVHVKKRAPTQ
jgi:hypothetical protein